MRTSDFDFVLPPDRIAQAPTVARGQSRMLVLHAARGLHEHRGVGDVGDYLRPGDVLVLNDTRVLAARLFGRRRDTGGRVEVLLLEPRAGGHWLALYRSRGHARPGLELDLAEGALRARLISVHADGRIELALQADEPLEQVLDTHGVPPLPPYIRRERDGEPGQLACDRERYQTVYARHAGAVAAPTAGLHFSEAMLDALRARGVRTAMITLHVGLGTFRPVKTEVVEEHSMESERYVVSPEAAAVIRDARAVGGRVVAVGSTSVRTLETVFREHGEIVPGEGRSALFIKPPQAFGVVDAMLTNFHLPRSTLLMMVSALAGWRARGASAGPLEGRDLVLDAYHEAIRAEYRFYSYGDCMLIL